MALTNSCSTLLIVFFIVVVALILKVVKDLNNDNDQPVASDVKKAKETTEPYKCNACSMRS